MADYKAMYLTLFDATEKAVNLLIQAQRDCEEQYLAAQAPKLTVIEPDNAT